MPGAPPAFWKTRGLAPTLVFHSYMTVTGQDRFATPLTAFSDANFPSIGHC